MSFPQQSFSSWFKLREPDKGKQPANVTHAYQKWDYTKEGHIQPKDTVGTTGSRLKSLKKACDPTVERLAEESARARKYEAHTERRKQNLVEREWCNGNSVLHVNEPELRQRQERHRVPQDPAALYAEDMRRKRIGAGPEWSSRYHIQFDQKEQQRLDHHYAGRKAMDLRQTSALIGHDRPELKSQGVKDNFQSYDRFAGTEIARDIAASDWIKPVRAQHKPRERDTITGTDDIAPKEQNAGWLHHYRHRRSQTRNPITTGEEPTQRRPLPGSARSAHLSSNPITEWPVDNRTLSKTVTRSAVDPLRPYNMAASQPYHASDPNPRAEPATLVFAPRAPNPITHDTAVSVGQ